MLFDNENFTNRQRRVIYEIGRNFRKRLDHEKRKLIVLNLIVLFIPILFGVLLSVFDNNQPQYYFFVIVFIFIVGFNIYKKIKDLNHLKNQDDYIIGLFYADKDKRVIGTADKKLKQVRLSSVIIALVTFFISVIVGAIVFNQGKTDFDKLTTVEGIIEEAKYSSEKIDIKLKDDDTIYRITSIYVDVFDYDEFNEVAKEGDMITFLCDEKRNNFRPVYYVEVNGVEFLTKDEVLKADEENIFIGKIICFVFLGIALISFGSYIYYKNFIYKRNKENEYLNLDFTEAELKELEESLNKGHIDINNEIYIKTGYPKSYLILYLIFGVISLGLLIGSVFALNELVAFLVLLSLGLLFGLMVLIGIYDLTKNFEELKGNKLIAHRFFKKKEIDISELKLIRITPTYIKFIDKDGKTFCRMASQTLRVGEIIEELSNRGVRVESDIVI